ncbi:MAG: hypothetical protein QJR02_07260 [Sinobacteraceae bacterium]|nr:hypothetical protein [Nevskiaceae bacterium]
MPVQTREAPITGVNPEARTVEVTWTTGARVLRYDWVAERPYLEELSLDPAHVRMGRLQSGKAPVLDTHNRYGLGNVLGVVSRAELNGSAGTATLRLSKRADIAPIVDDIRDGIIANVSVGYSIFKMERIPPARDGDPWVYRAVDWEPAEISFVPVGADAGAGTRAHDDMQRKTRCEFFDVPAASAADSIPPAAAGNSREASNMTEDDIKAAEAAEAKRKADAAEAARKAEEQAARDRAQKEAREAEAARQAEIRELAAAAHMTAAFTERLLADTSITPAQAGLAILREQARLAAEVPIRNAAHIVVNRDEMETRRARMGDAIRLRANPAARLAVTDSAHAEAVSAAREFRGQTLIDMARECIEFAGGRTRSLSRREIAVAALNLDPEISSRAGMQSTSDFPNVLASTINRTLRQAYQLAPRTFTVWARQATAPDFRQVARVQLSDISAFQKVNEGGEYKVLTFGDSAEKYSLSKYGGIVPVSWEAIINDDLGAFDRIPTLLANEAAATESDIVYGVLSANAPMADGVALFHATHGNLQSATAISDTSLGVARAAMRKQTGPKGRQLNLTPGVLLVGPDKEVEANKYTSASFVATKAADINPNFNTSLAVVVDGRITGNTWYLMARPELIDTVEYAYLEGEEGLFTETRIGYEVDGLMVKARHVFAAKAIDWRGMQKNPGA